ncbi:hypothetical protein [Sphingobacterium detergens]|nr:hypothetical protein [Sphingobacterium detergens]
MKLESLNSEKFATLTNEQKLHVRGGGKTGGGRLTLGAEYKQEGDRAYQRINYRSYGSDDIGEGHEFYYDTKDYWTDWMLY